MDQGEASQLEEANHEDRTQINCDSVLSFENNFHEIPFSSSVNENNQTVKSGCNHISKSIFGLDFDLILNQTNKL